MNRAGAYELGDEIGRGGMGVVLRGRSPSGQPVAVKLLHASATGEARARFERERRLLTALGESDGFVPLLDSGTTARGPFIVMPLIEGGSLRQRLERGPLPVAAAVAVGITLARSLGRAHALGIVHRDLKPENVLFTRPATPGAEGAALVADFGLARHFEHDRPGASGSLSLTGGGDFRGTPGYMAPEQMRDVHAATPRADVFALGAILYECLAGVAPFAGGSVIEVIVRAEKGEFVPLARARPGVPGHVAETIDRALASDPARRFADGEELARALATTRGAPRRWPLAAFAGLLALAAAGAAAALAGRRDPPPAAPPPPVAAAPVAPVTTKATPPKAFEEVVLGPFSLTESWGVRARPRFRHLSVVMALALSTDGARIATATADGSLVVWDARTGDELARLDNAQTMLRDVALSSDGGRVACAGEGGVAIHDLRERGAPRLLREPAVAVAFTVGDDLLVARLDGAVERVDARGASVARLRASAELTEAALAPGTGRALVATKAGTLELLDLERGATRTLNARPMRDAKDPGTTGLAFAPGERRAVSADDGLLTAWDLEAGTGRMLGIASSHVTAAAFSPDGGCVVTGDRAGDVQLWDARSDVPGAVTTLDLRGHLSCVAFAEDGEHVFVGCESGELRKLRVANGAAAIAPASHAVNALHVGRGQIVWGTGAGEVRARSTGAVEAGFAAGAPVLAVRAVGGSLVAATSAGEVVRQRTPSTPLQRRRWVPSANENKFKGDEPPDVRSAVLLGDGLTGLLWSAKGPMALVSLSGAEGPVDDRRPPLYPLALSTDERSAAYASRNVVFVRDIARKKVTTVVVEHLRWVTALAFTPGGRRVIGGTEAGGIAVVEHVASRARVAEPRGAARWVTALAVSHDGKHVAAGTADRLLVLWDLEARAELARVPLPDAATSVAFADEDAELVVGTEAGELLRFTR